MDVVLSQYGLVGVFTLEAKIWVRTLNCVNEAIELASTRTMLWLKGVWVADCKGREMYCSRRDQEHLWCGAFVCPCK